MSSQGFQPKENDDTFNITAKIPQFFKIILQSTVLEGRLRIPKKFVKNHGKCLSSPMILKVPTGNTWKVELLRSGDDVWLAKGWQEFTEYHSLKHGNMLVFKYEGDCQFSVLIFDMSAVEIEYPDRDIHSGKETEKHENEEDFKGKVQNKRSKGNQSPVIDIDDSDCFIQESRGKSSKLRRKRGVGKKPGRPPNSNISTDHESANKFTSSYPYFEAILGANGTGQIYVRVPTSFIRAHMKCETHAVKLKVAEKTWRVNLYINLQNSASKLCGGFTLFLRENGLKKGDVCIFELIGRRMMNVHIIKRASDA
ncbi:hypothetical protein MANES_07G112902v8 [Manihot esculenta]|uniref:TF-B3 domain-containing protein n=1 Tax=Manihot esculenta TaxID=3983 RepID=A0A2C9VKF9_MANES|nr:hypothetical protein MANES_07G112902v8 [Manihot esculenta]